MDFQLNSKTQAQCSIHFFSKKGNKFHFCSCASPMAKSDIQKAKAKTDDKVSFGEVFFYRLPSGDSHQLLVGTGEGGNLSAEQLRQLTGFIYKRLQAEKVTSASLSLAAVPMKDKAHAVQALTEGFEMSAYRFETFKAKPMDYDLKLNFNTNATNAKLKKSMEEGKIVAEGVNLTRWLGDCPGNFMTPTQLAEEAKKSAKGTKMKVTVWDKARIAKEKMDSLIGVSNGSAEEPRFIIMEYKGAAASKKPICFVGKGLTFDCGGISIKPSAGMEEMKFDMCGGGAVIGAMATIARLKLKVNAIAFVPASENMPGPAANKPGDIRKARNGKSIEINNTDAEGRLILADALCYASEKKPAWIVDAATLTGAMVIALGNTHTGFYTRDNKMRDTMNKAADDCGEWVWQMPLTDYHTKDMVGFYADLTNLAPNRQAGSATAAAFLESFVEKGIPWVHCDVAGTAWHAGNRLEYAPKKGASGAMVRTFVQLAKNHK
ncbi:MAG: leucyl aminopeptidase [Bdellovibrionales bacterium]|nr:leucyl aminopeptidase [Bdellovibrionales bacterium]